MKALLLLSAISLLYVVNADSACSKDAVVGIRPYYLWYDGHNK
jgi:hypothetical protein